MGRPGAAPGLPSAGHASARIACRRVLRVGPLSPEATAKQLHSPNLRRCWLSPLPLPWQGREGPEHPAAGLAGLPAGPSGGRPAGAVQPAVGHGGRGPGRQRRAVGGRRHRVRPAGAQAGAARRGLLQPPPWRCTRLLACNRMPHARAPSEPSPSASTRPPPAQIFDPRDLASLPGWAEFWEYGSMTGALAGAPLLCCGVLPQRRASLPVADALLRAAPPLQ